MYGGVTKNQRNPQETANPISILFFWWLSDLFWKGSQKDLEQEDLYAPLSNDESEKLGDLLEREWNRELEKLKQLEYAVDSDGKKVMNKKNRPQLLKALVRAFWPEYLSTTALLFVLSCVVRVLTPVLQGWIINYFSVDPAKKTAREDALIFAASLIVSILVGVFMMHHGNTKCFQLGMRLRVACSSLMYRKSLRLSKSALTQTTVGQVINLLSNDVNRFEFLPVYLPYLVIMPIQVVLVAYLIWIQVGVAMFFGVGSLIVMTTPSQWLSSNLSKRIRAKIAPLTDGRVQLMNELVAGIQVVKMYAWEKPFESVVSRIRNSEIAKIKWAGYIRGVSFANIVIVERTALFFTIVPFILLGNELTADTTYVLFTFFNVLQLSTALYFPQALIMGGETMISVKRIQEYLLLDEVTHRNKLKSLEHQDGLTGPKTSEKDVKERFISKSDTDEIKLSRPVLVEMNRVSANWVNGVLPPTLCNISMKVEKGQLCAIVGPVGSGKSSILNVFLRELNIGAGTVAILENPLKNEMRNKRGYIVDNPGIRISYASQEPWLFCGTVRDNILFGEPFERSRYLAVTRACALTKDFKQLPQGDMTLVGDRGTSLSGGQKARINLARAVYKEADLYLLDDPLGAVDTKVGQHLFKRCIKEYLDGKTRILATHQLQFLKLADTIVALEHGYVKMQGTFAELSEQDQDFVNLLNSAKMIKSSETSTDYVSREESTRSSMSRRSIRRRTRTPSVVSSTGSSESDVLSTISNEESEAVGKGQLSWDIYITYFRQGGCICTLILLATIFILAQVATSGCDYWTTYMTNLETIRARQKKNSTSDEKVDAYRNSFLSMIFTFDSDGLLPTSAAIYVYTFCILSCIALTLGRTIFLMNVLAKAGKNLHNLMFSNLLLATMRFFNTNSSGRILNRFSKDVGTMDEVLPRVTLETYQIFLVMFAILILEGIMNQWFLIAIFILAVIFCTARIFFLRTAQSVKRLEGVTKSPVFSHVNSTLTGLSTIRSTGTGVEGLLRREFDRLQDVHSGSFYLTFATASAFGILLDLISTIFIACIVFTFLLTDDGNTFGGDVGLAISEALIMVGTVQYGIRQSAELVSQMTSVERILQYTNLPQEGSLISNDPPPPSWPLKGRLTFKNLSMRYDKDSPPVLKDLTITIEPGWKVGVVGRTGAGKSSLLSAIFRLYAESMDGSIMIDERDTSTLGLHELRSRISIIPQEPVLFSETLRYNLDPFKKYDDMTLWDVLREVELGDVSLDQKVMGSGVNFSVGQRQLICLARAILRNNRILVLDEATANIDSRTDALIQNTLRTKFADCTVITIAHRLNTIIDSDRVIVMENGRIVEFGCPYELLRDKPKGYFAEMVGKTGKVMSQVLFEQAEMACRRNTAQRSLELSHQSSIESL